VPSKRSVPFQPLRYGRTKTQNEPKCRYGSFWFIMAHYGSLWLIMGHFGSFCVLVQPASIRQPIS